MAFGFVWIYLQWNFLLMSSKTLSPQTDLLQGSVLKVDFLQVHFLLSHFLLLMEMRSCIVNLTLIEWCWVYSSLAEQVSVWTDSLCHNLKIGIKSLDGGSPIFMCTCWFLQTTPSMRYEAVGTTLLFYLLQSHKGKGGTKLNPVNYTLLFPDR